MTADTIRPALVDVTGTRRRLRALLAIGHSHSEMACRLGTTAQRLNVVVHDTGPGTVTRRTAAGVRALYDQLWDVPGSSARARAVASTRGWVPPLGWDDDDIDDPAAVPARPGPARPQFVVVTSGCASSRRTWCSCSTPGPATPRQLPG